ncbi:MAG TPA: cation:proton antiporter [Solirubrobacterales bacterium]
MPLAAATPVAGFLVDLLVVLVAAKLGDEIFKRLGQPAIVGEILAGLAIGPAVLGLVEPSEVLEVFAELGVVFVLFWVGLETRIEELRAVGRTSTAVGVLGVAVPFAAGFATGIALGEPTETALFLGAALSATSVGITSAVLDQLGLLRTRAARTILGAAVIDDVLALVLVAIATGIAAEGGVDAAAIAASIGLAAAFVIFVALGGTRLLRARPGLLQAPRFADSPLLPAVILCLALAAFAAEIGLAAVIGAFLAGMIVAETRDQHPIEDEVAPLYAFFPPFFFASIGIGLDLDALAGAVGVLVLITVVAVAGKLVAAGAGARGLPASERRIVAIGMVPRGEVGIIIAGIGAASGVIDAELFAAIVGMSVLTTVAAPPALRRSAAGGR